jgi:hypothetical protein
MKTMTIDKQSPYLNDAGYAELRCSVVAYIDLLGFKSEINRAKDAPAEAELLARLRHALDIGYVYLEPLPVRKRRPWDVKAFTDNIIIGHPIPKTVYESQMTGESQMQTVFANLGNFQLETIRNGFFLRGAIAVGHFYMGPDVVFGKCQIEAVEAEKKACDPKIILCPSAIKLIADLDKYFSIERSSQYRDLLLDVDGQVFLNYLSNVLVESQHTATILNEHKAMIETRLKDFAPEPKIWSKYLWVANYHNYFCRTFTNLGETSLIDIDQSGLRENPKRLTGEELKHLLAPSRPLTTNY